MFVWRSSKTRHHHRLILHTLNSQQQSSSVMNPMHLFRKNESKHKQHQIETRHQSEISCSATSRMRAPCFQREKLKRQNNKQQRQHEQGTRIFQPTGDKSVVPCHAQEIECDCNCSGLWDGWPTCFWCQFVDKKEAVGGAAGNRLSCGPSSFVCFARFLLLCVVPSTIAFLPTKTRNTVLTFDDKRPMCCQAVLSRHGHHFCVVVHVSLPPAHVMHENLRRRTANLLLDTPSFCCAISLTTATAQFLTRLMPFCPFLLCPWIRIKHKLSCIITSMRTEQQKS